MKRYERYKQRMATGTSSIDDDSIIDVDMLDPALIDSFAEKMDLLAEELRTKYNFPPTFDKAIEKSGFKPAEVVDYFIFLLETLDTSMGEDSTSERGKLAFVSLILMPFTLGFKAAKDKE